MLIWWGYEWCAIQWSRDEYFTSWSLWTLQCSRRWGRPLAGLAIDIRGGLSKILDNVESNIAEALRLPDLSQLFLVHRRLYVQCASDELYPVISPPTEAIASYLSDGITIETPYRPRGIQDIQGGTNGGDLKVGGLAILISATCSSAFQGSLLPKSISPVTNSMFDNILIRSLPSPPWWLSVSPVSFENLSAQAADLASKLLSWAAISAKPNATILMIA